ncbi:MAG: DUF2851 family protein [Gracilimonas sp.]|uniref:DUF2851 family protein n=1 Tax=Gracilimonas TaxID=649462 RepID=UPI001B2364E3|nr:DUF2851 family protein [Gracilimonas sp.]MBO6587390.1 DUF2851 family protein [Gracilimonas sp.]MBO6614124.1 DUF2851 family protein [Gracilimonas sp.]
MAKPGFAHSEAFLQWIWENLLFDFSDLQTTSGHAVTILNPGKKNVSDGPDFKQATLEIDGLRWHGDIELHTKSSNWKSHAHHTDPNFNSVVLHVVADSNPEQVQTQNRSRPYTLNILPYLSEKLHVFLKNFEEHSPELPCTSGFHFISEEAFYQQIEQAHREYFEKKSDDFLTFFDPNLLPSKAWKQALIISLWDGLGIPHNREAMAATAAELLKKWDGQDIIEAKAMSLEIAGFANSDSDLNWNYKSVRPANHPKKRIEQAVELSAAILQEPFNHFLATEAIHLWEQWFRKAALNQTARFEILFGTVYLPSLFLLGNLFASGPLKSASLSSWKNLRTPIPASLLKKFRPFHLQDKRYRKKLGSIHQLNSYCKASRCSECFVLKKAIQS